MKAFNLKEALQGKPVVTRDGRPVSQLVYFTALSPVERYTLHGVLEGRIDTWTSDGLSWISFPDSPKDLFMVGTKKEGWINVYEYKNTSVVHSTKKDADRFSSPGRVACIHAEWEE